MNPLVRQLRERIVAGGPISVETFIDVALNHPQLGYYRRRRPIGLGGDFITAPEISQAFGELLGLWVVSVWEAMGRPNPTVLAELGPGRGVLLTDLLRAVRQASPEALTAFSLELVEINPLLREEQRRALAMTDLPRSPVWRDTCEALSPGPCILIANEFFDVLPIRQFVRGGDQWRERTVDYDARQGRFVFSIGDVTPPPLPEVFADCEEGDVIELCPMGEALAATIGRRLAIETGAALIVDYGHTRSSFGETLQAVRGHEFTDPLIDPGEADLSHHVDFAALGRAATAAGATTFGPIPQGLFLGRLGIDVRARTLAAANPDRRSEIESAIRRLVHPGRMGLLFKVLALAQRAQPVPPGFAPLPREKRS